jgi:nicotinamidase-related amidase
MKRHGEGDYTYPDLEGVSLLRRNNLELILDKKEFDRISFSGEWKEDKKVRGVIHYRNGNNYEG